MWGEGKTVVGSRRDSRERNKRLRIERRDNRVLPEGYLSPFL
jgi:hypothetical protein